VKDLRITLVHLDGGAAGCQAICSTEHFHLEQTPFVSKSDLSGHIGISNVGMATTATSRHRWAENFVTQT
jgi:hypothetical protein